MLDETQFFLFARAVETQASAENGPLANRAEEIHTAIINVLPACLNQLFTIMYGVYVYIYV